MGLDRVTTVVTPASTYDLVDLATAKAELNIPNSDTSNDSWLTGAISQVSGAVSRYCNRAAAAADEASFPAETVQDLFYPDRDAYPYQVPGGLSRLQLSHWPVISVTSVTVTDPPGTDTTLTAGTDYVLDGAAGQLLRLNQYTAYPTSWAPLKTVVVYRSGYSPIPLDVVDAVLRWLTMRFNSRGTEANLKTIEQPGLGTKTYWVGDPRMAGGVPADIAELLDKYRVPVVA